MKDENLNQDRSEKTNVRREGGGGRRRDIDKEYILKLQTRTISADFSAFN